MAEREGLFPPTPLIPRFRSGPPSPKRSGVLRRRCASARRTFGLNPRSFGQMKLGKGPEVPFLISYGGEGGIRTLDGLLTHTPLAGARLRPLGHLSGRGTLPIRGARDDTRPEQSR